MIDNLKNNFSKLLTVSNAIGIKDSENSTAIFKHFDESYTSIRRKAASKIENLKIISDILSRYYDPNHIATGSNNSLKFLTDNMIDDMRYYVSFYSKEELIPFILKKGECLFNQGKIENAFNTWEDVLKVNPDNELIHSKLREILNGCTNPLTLDLLQQLNKMRKVYYVKKINITNLNSYFQTRKHGGIGFIGRVNNTLWISAASEFFLTYNPTSGTISKVKLQIPNNYTIAGALYCDLFDRAYLLLIHNNEYIDNNPVQASLSILGADKEDFSDHISRLNINNARGISISKNGFFAVCDISEKIIKVFDPDGHMISTVGEGQRIKTNFLNPNATLFDQHGNLFVCDQDLATIKKFDIKNDRLLWEISYAEKIIKGLALDYEGNCYTVSSATNTLYKINQQGEHVFKVSVPTMQANGVCVLGDHLYIYDIKNCSFIDYLIRPPEDI